MNKKVLGIVIGVVLAVVIVGVVVMTSKGIKPLKGVEAIIKPSIELDSPAKYVPNNAIMLYSVSDLRGMWEVIKTSNFWSQFLKLKILTDFAVKENMTKLLASFEEKAGMEITESRVMDLLGNRLVASVLFDSQSNEVKLILQSYVGKTTQFVEGIIKSLPEASGIKSTKVEYEGESIMTIITEPEENMTNNTTEIRYVLVNNILTVAFGKTEQDLKKVVELIKGKSNDKLYNENNYQDILAKLSGDEDGISTYYADFTKIQGKLQQILQPLMDASPEQFSGFNMEDLNKNLERLKGVAGKVVRTKEGLKAASFLIPNFEKMTDEQKAEWNKAVKPLETIRFAPDDALLYSATGNINAKAAWKGMIEAANVPVVPQEPNTVAKTSETPNPLAGMMDVLKQMEKSLGVNIENDIMGLIDNEFGFVFSGIALDSPVPIPRLGFVLKSTNPSGLKEKLKMVIEQLLSGENSPIQVNFEAKSIEGNEATVIKTPLGEAFSPVLVTVDSWVMLASNAVVAEKMLKTYKGSLNGLEKNSFFKDYSEPFSKSSQFSYSNLQSSVGLFSEVLGWVLQRKDLIPQMEQVQGIVANVTTYAIPVIDCLKVLNTMAFSAHNESDVSVQEVYVKITDLK